MHMLLNVYIETFRRRSSPLVALDLQNWLAFLLQLSRREEHQAQEVSANT